MNYNFWDFARILNGSLFMMTLYNGEIQTKIIKNIFKNINAIDAIASVD